MNSTVLVLGQLLGIDAATWAAIASATAGAGAWATAWQGRRDVSRTLEHAEGQARQRSYNEARDRVLGLFGRAFLEMGDVEREIQEMGFVPGGAAAHAKSLLADLRAAQLAFAAYAEPNDRIVEQLRDGIAAYHLVVDTVIANYASEFDLRDEELERYESALREVHLVADRLLESSWRRG